MCSCVASCRIGRINGWVKRFPVAISFFVVVICATCGVFFYSATQSLNELQRRGQSDLSLASDRLVSSLFGYRQLAVALASDPRLARLSISDPELTEILLGTSDFSGALDFVLLDRERQVIASASRGGAYDWRLSPFVSRALHGAMGRKVQISAESGRRAFYYAAPVFSESGKVDRVVVAVVDLESIEAEFRGSRPAVYVTDEYGIIYFSNRSELVLRDRNLSAAIGAAQSEDETIAPFVDFTTQRLWGFELWSVSAGRYLPRHALHLTRDLPVIGMTAEALIDLRPALINAGIQAAAAGAVMFLLGTVILVVARQRRRLTLDNLLLERRVAQRTRELSNANQSLRAEVTERLEAEEALQRAQEDLVQAEKLSALGKMSAGISHELNQPLMAIQSFADNAVTFLQRNNTETAARNLGKVSQLAQRMGRIIQNFRAFARQEKETVHRVDLIGVVRGAADLAEIHLKQRDATVHLDLPDAPVWVQGGEVRLQQVILNLITNATDAMAEADRREVHVTLTPGAPVLLSVRDNGPGIEEPDRVFEPFYSTKKIGEAEGVGLGLSISYGLVQSFGGNIRGQNHPDGGAIFTVELQPWSEEAAA